jgi:septal ring factor EnvC (AmiA/AmiB activator)
MSDTPRMDSAFNQPTSTTPRRNWQLDQCYREGCKFERELAAVTEQRDRMQSKIENQAERIKYLEGATNHATGTPLSKMREQRDRLAEALRELCETLLADKPRDITELLNKAGDALAAVKGGSDE